MKDTGDPRPYCPKCSHVAFIVGQPLRPCQSCGTPDKAPAAHTAYTPSCGCERGLIWPAFAEYAAQMTPKPNPLQKLRVFMAKGILSEKEFELLLKELPPGTVVDLGNAEEWPEEKKMRIGIFTNAFTYNGFDVSWLRKDHICCPYDVDVRVFCLHLGLFYIRIRDNWTGRSSDDPKT